MADELEQEAPLSPEMEGVYREALAKAPMPPLSPRQPPQICANCLAAPEPGRGFELKSLSEKAVASIFCSLRCLAIWAVTKGWAK